MGLVTAIALQAARENKRQPDPEPDTLLPNSSKCSCHVCVGARRCAHSCRPAQNALPCTPIAFQLSAWHADAHAIALQRMEPAWISSSHPTPLCLIPHTVLLSGPHHIHAPCYCLHTSLKTSTLFVAARPLCPLCTAFRHSPLLPLITTHLSCRHVFVHIHALLVPCCQTSLLPRSSNLSQTLFNALHQA